MLLQSESRKNVLLPHLRHKFLVSMMYHNCPLRTPVDERCCASQTANTYDWLSWAVGLIYSVHVRLNRHQKNLLVTRDVNGSMIIFLKIPVITSEMHSLLVTVLSLL
jgi:hypothetical protein